MAVIPIRVMLDNNVVWHVTCRLQLHVQQLVLDVRELHHEKENMGISSKETRRVDRAIHSKKGKIRAALKELALWEVAGTQQSPDAVLVDEAKISKMISDMEAPFPWEAQQQGGEAGAVAQFHGRKYYMLWSEVQRCTEQLGFLKVERERLEAYLTRVIAACTAACSMHGIIMQEVGAAATPAAAWAAYDQAGTHAGRLYFIRQHLAWCQKVLGQVHALQW